jgi:hypothetical protein
MSPSQRKRRQVQGKGRHVTNVHQEDGNHQCKQGAGRSRRTKKLNKTIGNPESDLPDNRQSEDAAG